MLCGAEIVCQYISSSSDSSNSGNLNFSSKPFMIYLSMYILHIRLSNKTADLGVASNVEGSLGLYLPSKWDIGNAIFERLFLVVTNSIVRSIF